MAEEKKSGKPKKDKRSKGVGYYRQEAYSWRKMYLRLMEEWREFLKIIKDLAVQVSEERLRREQAENRLAELENAQNWHTSCVSCSRLLESGREETVRADKAEELIEKIHAQAQAWANDPDLEGSTMEMALVLLRALEGEES